MTTSANHATPVSKKPRVVIAMIEAGGGHKSVSKAVAEALDELYPGALQVDIPDFALETGARDFDAKHKAQWNSLLDKPFITRIAYRVQDFFGPLTRFFVKQWAKEYFEKAESWFWENDPDVFVSTHWLNAAVACSVKKKNPGLKFKHLYYLTEPLDASSLQIWKEADRYLVGSERVAGIYRKRGIDPAKIAVIGFPVSPSFFKPSMPRQALLAHYGLNPALPLLVMSSGAEGLGSLSTMANKVIEENLPLNLVVVCGRNERLRVELNAVIGRRFEAKDAGAGTGHKTTAGADGETALCVKALGFTPDMPNLTAAADIVAIKSSPGGTFEALFSRKPVIFIEGVAAYEGIIARLAAERGAGWIAKKPSDLIRTLKLVLNRPELLEQCSQRAGEFGMENGAYPLAREIGKVLGL